MLSNISFWQWKHVIYSNVLLLNHSVLFVEWVSTIKFMYINNGNRNIINDGLKCFNVKSTLFFEFFWQFLITPGLHSMTMFSTAQPTIKTNINHLRQFNFRCVYEKVHFIVVSGCLHCSRISSAVPFLFIRLIFLSLSLCHRKLKFISQRKAAKLKWIVKYDISIKKVKSDLIFSSNKMILHF